MQKAQRLAKVRTTPSLIELGLQAPPGAVVLAVPVDDYPLPPEEARCVRGASERRRRQFASGRHAARAALRRLCGAAPPILRAGRRPCWPAGCVGAISHSDSLAVAAVAPKTAVRGIGIDLERVGRLKPALHRKVLTESERQRPWPDPREGVLAFSAKEAGYKAVNPLTDAFIAFQEAEAVLDWERSAFRLAYLGSHAPNRLLDDGVGTFGFVGDQVVTLFFLD